MANVRTKWRTYEQNGESTNKMANVQACAVGTTQTPFNAGKEMIKENK